MRKYKAKGKAKNQHKFPTLNNSRGLEFKKKIVQQATKKIGSLNWIERNTENHYVTFNPMMENIDLICLIKKLFNSLKGIIDCLIFRKHGMSFQFPHTNLWEIGNNVWVKSECHVVRKLSSKTIHK